MTLLKDEALIEFVHGKGLYVTGQGEAHQDGP